LALHAPNESTRRQRPVLVIEIVMYGAKKIRETILIVQLNLFASNIVILRAANNFFGSSEYKHYQKISVSNGIC
jgi:hypothetical protein